MKFKFRCTCPVTSALDLFGDKWSFVIVKQMLFEQKSSFREFVASDESIATNILTSRLKKLVHWGIVEKQQLPSNKKNILYTLTESGIELAPVLVELTLWSQKHLPDFPQDQVLDQQLQWVAAHKAKAIEQAVLEYTAFKRQLLTNADSDKRC